MTYSPYFFYFQLLRDFKHAHRYSQVYHPCLISRLITTSESERVFHLFSSFVQIQSATAMRCCPTLQWYKIPPCPPMLWDSTPPSSAVRCRRTLLWYFVSLSPGMHFAGERPQGWWPVLSGSSRLLVFFGQVSVSACRFLFWHLENMYHGQFYKLWSQNVECCITRLHQCKQKKNKKTTTKKQTINT